MSLYLFVCAADKGRSAAGTWGLAQLRCGNPDSCASFYSIGTFSKALVLRVREAGPPSAAAAPAQGLEQDSTTRFRATVLLSSALPLRFKNEKDTSSTSTRRAADA
eukprot:3938741-Rhodomonas_salina.1